jgi:3-oxoacyl-[acyl-carrier protein] reductase
LNALDLKGHRALVCGASKGIGREIAVALADAGAEVILLARSEVSLGENLERLRASAAHQFLAVDLKDRAVLKTKVTELLKDGPVDILVNNAGGPPGGPLLEAEEKTFLDAFETHVLSAQLLAQLLVPGMKEKSFGRIINIISTSVKIPIHNLGVSNTIRGAMASWSKTLANELGPFGITVNNILPGYTATDRLETLKQAGAKRQGVETSALEKQWLESIPARRFGQPQETAAAALFLASKMASYVNGVSLPVDGGRTGAL